jgi:hypothetical protein
MVVLLLDENSLVDQELNIIDPYIYGCVYMKHFSVDWRKMSPSFRRTIQPINHVQLSSQRLCSRMDIQSCTLLSALPRSWLAINAFSVAIRTLSIGSWSLGLRSPLVFMMLLLSFWSRFLIYDH